MNAIVGLFYNNALNKHPVIFCTFFPTFQTLIYDICTWLCAFIAVERALIECFDYSVFRTRNSGNVIKAFGRAASKSPVLSTTAYVCSVNSFSNKNLAISYK
ncbi:unnamed protein product, partial [Rotaria sp. Silwood2]